MTVGRNDPCPCGSGRKYKNCCLGRDEKAGFWTRMGLPAPDPEAAASEPVWQAEIVPVHTFIDEEPDARPAVLLVTAGVHPIHAEMLTRPSAEAEDIAAELARGIRETMAKNHFSPADIQVRYDDVADCLRNLLDPDDIAVTSALALTGLDTCANFVKSHFWGNEDYPGVQPPKTWAGWGLSEEWIGTLHRAAAAFYRARPWTWFPASKLVQACLPDGREWSCLVMGDAAMEVGISLYSSKDDLVRMLSTGNMNAGGDTFAKPPGRVITMLFDERGELSRKMVREVTSHGWELASSSAYPFLLAANSPAGGITARDGSDLILIIDAVAGFTREKGREIINMMETEWSDENGVVLRLENLVHDDSEVFADPVWPLEPGRAEGGGANPEAGLQTQVDMDEFIRRQMDIVNAFRVWLEEKGLKEIRVRQQCQDVKLFLDFLTRDQVVPIAAVHEYDLRLFLYVWFPSEVIERDQSRAKNLLTALKNLFQFLVEEKEIICSWSASILADRKSFIQRWKSCPFLFEVNTSTEHWEQEGYADLVSRQFYPDGSVVFTADWKEFGIGVEEKKLRSELHRRWLIWRDELFESGIEHPGDLRAELIERQRLWEQTPHPLYRPRSPIDVIEDERMKLERVIRTMLNAQ